MKKVILFVILLLTLPIVDSKAQTKQQDSLAIMILDRMSAMIGDLESCSFQLSTATDIPDSTFGLTKGFTDYEVFLSGPNKMLINEKGKKGARKFMYDGHQLAYYSFDENNYGILPALETTLKTIDNLNASYDIDFPAADFFYPAFTEDLLEDANVIRFLGIVELKGKQYFHVIASGNEKNFEFWISNDAYHLPARFVVTYKTKTGHPQYQAAFSDWQINPALPQSMFDFLPPPGAREVRMLSKNEN